MKICVAQTRPIKGNIEANIDSHRRLIDLAIPLSVDTIIFPELSITGYEPELSKELATNQNDSRLAIFQEISDSKKMVIGVGVPMVITAGIQISMLLFQPGQERQVYAKKYLHLDELPFFVGGVNLSTQINSQPQVGLAICYEISVPEHAEIAFKNGSEIYIASAVKSKTSIGPSVKTLSAIAKKYSMMVLLSNCIGETGGYDCPGKSSAWNKDGLLIGELDDQHEGILVLDTDSNEIEIAIL
jgi:predicted amidohydrolase